MSRNNLGIGRAFALKLVPALDSRNFLDNARLGQIHCRHWRNHHAAGIGDVERICAEMAGAIARRYSNRARTFCILFSRRHLHRSQHPIELAAINLPALVDRLL
jgi:hypothetical protein